MSHPTKEKRTKEEILRLLDRALEQEELQAKKILALESALQECRKKAEDPRAELNETALPASKISFRIDYYRPAETSPVKGIVEHLPSRTTCSFNGDGFEEIARFVAQFMPQNNPNVAHKKKKEPVDIGLKTVHTTSPEPVAAPGHTVVSPLLHKLMPDLFPEKTSLPIANDELIPANRLMAEAFSIVGQGKHTHTGSLHKSEPFQIEIPTGELTEFYNRPCTLRLHLESLETGNNIIITDTCMPEPGKPIIPHKPLVLQETGAYRVTAVLTRADDPRSAYYRESRLLVVV